MSSTSNEDSHSNILSNHKLSDTSFLSNLEHTLKSQWQIADNDMLINYQMVSYIAYITNLEATLSQMLNKTINMDQENINKIKVICNTD